MKAIVVNGKGGVETLSEKQVALPTVGAHDLLLEVRASAANPVDVKQRKSNSTPDRVLGFDGSGIVKALGDQVDKTRFAVGDEVFWAGSITRPGSFAQFEAVDARAVAKKPKSLDFGAAAAIPLVALTAFEPIFENLRLPLDGSAANKVVLIVGGAGGVGSAVIQVAKHLLRSQTIIATASRPETEEWCRNLGATHIINHRKSLREELDRIGVAGVDIAYVTTDLDLHYDGVIPCMNVAGAIIAITLGANADKVAVNKLFWRRLTLSFELMFARLVGDAEVHLQGQALDVFAKLVDEGKFKPIHTTTLKGLTVENVKKSQELLESSSTIGKIVIEH